MKTRFARALCFVSVCAAPLAWVGCHDHEAASADASIDVETTSAVTDAGAVDAHVRGAVTKLGAANFMVSVCDIPAWPESNTGAKRLGYLRAGAVVNAYANALVNDDCKEGWFELENGGWVCGKAAITDIGNARVKRTPKQPDTDAGMPYKYGVNLGTDTPLYRRVLSLTDRQKYEPWLAPKPAVEEAGAPSGDDSDSVPQTTGAPAASGATATGATTSGATAMNGTSTPDDDSADKAATADTKTDSNDSKSEGKHDKKSRDAGIADKGDAGKPTLKDLKGHGVLVRKMSRGFYLALDRDFKAAGAHWWRTTFGFAVPFDRVMLQPGVTKHHGAWFDGPFAPHDIDAGAMIALFDPAIDAGRELPRVAFVTSGYANKIAMTDDGKPGWGTPLPRRTSLLLTGREQTTGGGTFLETTAGFWVRPSDLTIAKPEIPPDLAPNEKWIDVDLTRQALVAYEGLRPVFATLISSGRRNPQDKEKDFPTPQGTFHIREKHVTTTMDGDVASDGPYSIEDVPWVMYFEGSYALHGAFWHDQFGWKRSHGCVNLAPEDAKQLFAWSDPPLPAAWHGVFSIDSKPGTRVVIHEDPAPKH